ncbi:hypothetical protein ACWF82_06530 [Nocardia sp. NPDC055053]
MGVHERAAITHPILEQLIVHGVGHANGHGHADVAAGGQVQVYRFFLILGVQELR